MIGDSPINEMMSSGYNTKYQRGKDGFVALVAYTNDGTVLASYVPGVSMTKGGETYYYHHDRLGSTRFLTDSSGDIVQEYDYDAWGNTTAETGILSQPYQYVGEQWYYEGSSTGLQLLGKRWYDAETGRFISRDPIGTKSGINLYGYTRDNPVNGTDAKGLLTCSYAQCMGYCMQEGNELLQGCLDSWGWTVTGCKMACIPMCVIWNEEYGVPYSTCLTLCQRGCDASPTLWGCYIAYYTYKLGCWSVCRHCECP